MTYNKAHKTMKTSSVFFVICFYFNISSLAQTKFGNEQIIQYSSNKSKITFEIIDFDSNEPLIGANLYSKDGNQLLGQTDLYGIVVIDKQISNRFYAKYIGYDSLDFLIDNNIDCIIVRLIPSELNYGFVIDPYKNYSLNKSISLEAVKDLGSKKIQLYSQTKPTNEQIELANNYGFKFLNNNEKSGNYIFIYNEEVLNYLNKKYQIDIRAKLLETGWINHQ
jgi:hypothetical protein